MTVQSWPDLIAAYHEKIALISGEETFGSAMKAIVQLVEAIERISLRNMLFGWTSMHDVCIQQTAHDPYSCPYLRLAPKSSGEVELRFIDTPIRASQWHRTVPADQVA